MLWRSPLSHGAAGGVGAPETRPSAVERASPYGGAASSTASALLGLQNSEGAAPVSAAASAYSALFGLQSAQGPSTASVLLGLPNAAGVKPAADVFSCFRSSSSAPAAPETSPGPTDGDIATQRVMVVGDSVMRGLERIFHQGHVSKSWRVDANDGREALSVPCTDAMMQQFDHVIYISAGNGMWKGDKDWNAVERNLRSFNRDKVSVILFGTCEFWAKLAPHYRPKRVSFFEDVKRVLQEQNVDVSQMIESIDKVEYCDTEGHPSKAARSVLVPILLDACRESVRRKVSLGIWG